MYLGIHVSSSGGIENSIKNGDKYGVNAIQMMLTPPMRWATKSIPDNEILSFVNALEKSSVKKILIHGIYLTNLARKDKQLFHLGKMGLVVYLDFAEKASSLIKKKGIDAEILGICFHPGSAKELSYEESMERVSYGIQWVLDEVPGTQKLLIETTAGAGTTLGRNFEELKKMRDNVKEKNRVGYVVDTQHTFSSGYDWNNKMEEVISEIQDELGIENVKAIHLNDSMSNCSSNKDRHADLGKGKLGEETISKILNNRKLKNIPFILETPSLKSPNGIVQEVAMLKKLARIS